FDLYDLQTPRLGPLRYRRQDRVAVDPERLGKLAVRVGWWPSHMGISDVPRLSQARQLPLPDRQAALRWSQADGHRRRRYAQGDGSAYRAGPARPPKVRPPDWSVR